MGGPVLLWGDQSCYGGVVLLWGSSLVMGE